MSALSYADMAYYEPQDRRTHQLNVRVPKATHEGLKDLARLWTHLEKTRTGDTEAEITVSDVVVRLLQVGLDGAWSEVGLQPKSEDQWRDLLKRADHLFLGEKQSSSKKK